MSGRILGSWPEHNTLVTFPKGIEFTEYEHRSDKYLEAGCIVLKQVPPVSQYSSAILTLLAPKDVVFHVGRIYSAGQDTYIKFIAKRKNNKHIPNFKAWSSITVSVRKVSGLEYITV